MKSDDEKLRELFETEEKPKLRSPIKRAKFLSSLKTTIISFMIFIILGFFALILNSHVLSDIAQKKEKNLWSLYNIAKPNAYLSNTQIDNRLMTGDIEYVRYRFLGKKLITDGNYKEDYSYIPFINGVYGSTGDNLYSNIASSEQELEDMINYNKVGKRIMKFYHPSIQYDNYINDLEVLDNIGSDKVMELSLSFDIKYSLDEVKNMLPKEITLNWYWVDTLTDKPSETRPKPIFEESEVYGIKALDGQGRPMVNPEENFIGSLERLSDSYNSLFNRLSNGKDKITKDDLKVVGVVVSGDVESLKNLKGKSYIKAASLGAVADKY
ncbi:anti sigma factor C-terminal domain-containing protein [Clostridium sp. UBA1652]|uniref:anti sigma factor C-terminal domain-containing protein n=1 Tax=Clostridium sp. UBA1652 TaxID=1946348 RepID=UPI00257A8E1D|nr:anti sigma factor C-terminal domain-containing protein [Clostridium sp. UBA1652]